MKKAREPMMVSGQGAWGLMAFGVAALVAADASADGLDAGLWRVTNKAEINGAVVPPTQNMRCLTRDDVADLDKTFSAVSRTTNSTCERVEHEFTPQHLKWRLQCTGQLDMDVAGEFRFEARDHYTGTVLAQASMLGRVVQSVRTDIDAQWVGECQR
jgi:hypothetical protein